MNIRSLTRQPILTLAFHEGEARWTLGPRGRITSAGSVELPPGLMLDGVIADSLQAGYLLRGAPAFPGRSRMTVVLAVPAQRSVFRRMDVPALPDKQLADLVAREIRREMPMLGDNAHITWKKCGEAGGQANIFIAAVARDVLESHIEATRAAGLQPSSADLRVIAAARAVGSMDALVANVEDAEAELAIIRDGVPAVVRYVAMLSAPEDQAWGDQLAEEIARTMKFYRDSHRDDDALSAVPVSFVGGAAQRAILSPQVPAATGMEVAMPPMRLALRPEEHAVRFAANIGLAMKDLAA